MTAVTNYHIITPELHNSVTDLEVSKLQNSLGQVTLFSLYSDSVAPLYPLGNAAIQMTVSSCTFLDAKAEGTGGKGTPLSECSCKSQFHSGPTYRGWQYMDHICFSFLSLNFAPHLSRDIFKNWTLCCFVKKKCFFTFLIL